MINPRSINIACSYTDPIDQETCIQNAIQKIYDNKAANLAEIPALTDAVNLQNTNLNNCSQFKNCYSGTDWSMYKNLQLQAYNNLNTCNSYISDADSILKTLNTQLSDLHNSIPYKDAIRAGATPSKPVNPTTAVVNTATSYLTPISLKPFVSGPFNFSTL